MPLTLRILTPEKPSKADFERGIVTQEQLREAVIRIAAHRQEYNAEAPPSPTNASTEVLGGSVHTPEEDEESDSTHTPTNGNAMYANATMVSLNPFTVDRNVLRGMGDYLRVTPHTGATDRQLRREFRSLLREQAARERIQAIYEALGRQLMANPWPPQTDQTAPPDTPPEPDQPAPEPDQPVPDAPQVEPAAPDDAPTPPESEGIASDATAEPFGE